jgi:hypothetical protein
MPDALDEFLSYVWEPHMDGLGNLTLTLRIQEGLPRQFNRALWGSSYRCVWEGGD